MIEKILYDYLKAYSLLNVPVYMDIPAKPGNKFVSVEKIDAGKTNKINACTVVINSYADTKYNTIELSSIVKQAMEDLGETSSLVFSCELGGESDKTDTANKKYRYETIWNIFF